MLRYSAYRTVFRLHFSSFELKISSTRIACPAAMGKYATHYTDEELKAIKEQWLQDKKRIDANPAFEYHHDKDREYGRFLNNKNLQLLFRHAARLYWHGVVRPDFLLHPREKVLVPKVYEKIKEDGYYTRSKKTEKEIRTWFGKAISRQTAPKR